MDAATDDSELSVQRTAASSIHELEASIEPLLFSAPGASVIDRRDDKRPLRAAVRRDGLSRLINALSPFQELPQLLDPSLEKLTSPLSTALIQCLSHSSTSPNRSNATSPSFATCQLLYTLCRIRGHKVIVRFLSNEARHLVPLVGLLERHLDSSSSTDSSLSWEEKYVFLLWLSHLVLTPFPLSSTGKGSKPASKRVLLSLPPDLDLVARICNLALSQLASSGKERDAAVLVLVNLTMRPDMIKPQLMSQLLDLIHGKLAGSTQASPNRTHEVIGAFSLLAGIFSAAGARTIAPHVDKTARFILSVIQAEHSENELTLSAVTRKLMVKILRYCALAALNLAPTGSSTMSQYSSLADDIIEDTIEQLLNCLGDPDTPVRYAASKALSVITLKLDPDMGSEVMEAVMSSLDEGVLWAEDATSAESNVSGSFGKKRDVALVNPLRWQGLMLTLSQLLYRKAPSTAMLPAVINSLLLGLSFEQRTSAGLSVGGPVRDAANFGIWALARHYSTAELQSVRTSAVQSITDAARGMSLLQILACELVSAACLDPSGNIRRGSSAALQELIGRHPDTVEQGISVVQAVDYHAVALRSSALTKVTPSAAGLHEVYRRTLLAGLLGWRGVLATDAVSRRCAAEATGQLSGDSPELATSTLTALQRELEQSQLREVETRHGLILAAESVVAAAFMNRSDNDANGPAALLRSETQALWQFFGTLATTSLTNPTLRPYLTCEAVFRLLRCLCQLSSQDAARLSLPDAAVVRKCFEFIELCSNTHKGISLSEVAGAARALFLSEVLTIEDQPSVAEKWIDRARHVMRAGTGKQAEAIGWTVILSHIYEKLHDRLKSEVVGVLVFATSKMVEVEVRVAALEAFEYLFRLKSASLSENCLHDSISQAMLTSLCDYTTDQRGDVGSLVRVASLNCASQIPGDWLRANQNAAWSILALSCGLAVEKLDRVRTAAWPCVVAIAQTLPSVDVKMYALALSTESSTNTDRAEPNQGDLSHITQFLRILEIAASHKDNLLVPTLTGLVTATGTGSENVLSSSRQALQLLAASDRPEIGLELLKALMKVLSGNLEDERLAPQALAAIVFLFETRTLAAFARSSGAVSVFRELFVLVQQSHLKSTSIPRLAAAVDIYTSLASISCVHTSAIKKLSSMLAHPFPLVRGRAAEGLYVATKVDAILSVDWSTQPAAHREETTRIKEAVLVS